MPIKLGELLLRENMISPEQLQDALNHQKARGGKLSKVFVGLGFVTDEEIMGVLSRQYGVPAIDLDHFAVDPEIIRIIPAETARKYQVLPLARSGATLTIAMADPTNVFAIDDIKFMTSYKVEPVVASERALEEGIDHYYKPVRPSLHRLTPKLSVDRAPLPPPVQVVNRILADSIRCRTSEIHIERKANVGRVSYRLNGRVQEAGCFPGYFYDHVVDRLRLMSDLFLADRRKGQEGGFHIRVTGFGCESSDDWSFTFAVSVTPDGNSSSVVLHRTASEGNLSQLAPPAFCDEALFQTRGSFRLRLVPSSSGNRVPEEDGEARPDSRWRPTGLRGA